MWSEGIWSQVMKRLEVKEVTNWEWSELKCRCFVQCGFYHWFVVMQFVCGLLYTMSYHCYLLCVFCFLFCSNYSFYVFHFSLYVCFIVLCFCIVLCIVSSHVHCSRFTICAQVYWPLPPTGNPTAVDKYHLISIVRVYLTTVTQHHTHARTHTHTYICLSVPLLPFQRAQQMQPNPMSRQHHTGLHYAKFDFD
jgi:hypothetical protein